MKRALTLLSLVIAVSICVSPGAAPQEVSYTPWREIASVSQDARGLVVTLQGSKIFQQSSCTNKFRILAGGPTGAAMIGAMQSAAAGQKEVRIRHSADVSRCEVEVFDLEARSAGQ